MLQGFHNHHIIPRYKGGDDSPENLVLLHPIDHAIAHLVRFKIYGNPADGWAYNRIINGLKDELIPSRKGIPKPYMRKPKSEETKAKMSAATKGKKKSPEAVEKVRAALKGRKATPEQLACLALGRKKPEGYVSPLKGKKRETPWMIGRVPATKGKPLSDETKAKLSAVHKGRKHSAEHLAKRMESRRLTRIARGQIRPFIVNGMQYESSRIASNMTGIPEPTLRYWASGNGKPSARYAHITECRWA